MENWPVLDPLKRDHPPLRLMPSSYGAVCHYPPDRPVPMAKA
jgi:hypothetical protein